MKYLKCMLAFIRNYMIVFSVACFFLSVYTAFYYYIKSSIDGLFEGYLIWIILGIGQSVGFYFVIKKHYNIIYLLSLAMVLIVPMISFNDSLQYIAMNVVHIVISLVIAKGVFIIVER